mmetsp:Transcript_5000/g.18049  ORF Transcript_5000/g.18049 Transcript_5000/m.18049 type:complete len:258 (+) Transcript_5000:451-1224(+)
MLPSRLVRQGGVARQTVGLGGRVHVHGKEAGGALAEQAVEQLLDLLTSDFLSLLALLRVQVGHGEPERSYPLLLELCEDRDLVGFHRVLVMAEDLVVDHLALLQLHRLSPPEQRTAILQARVHAPPAWRVGLRQEDPVISHPPQHGFEPVMEVIHFLERHDIRLNAMPHDLVDKLLPAMLPCQAHRRRHAEAALVDVHAAQAIRQHVELSHYQALPSALCFSAPPLPPEETRAALTRHVAMQHPTCRAASASQTPRP